MTNVDYDSESVTILTSNENRIDISKEGDYSLLICIDGVETSLYRSEVERLMLHLEDAIGFISEPEDLDDEIGDV